MIRYSGKYSGKTQRGMSVIELMIALAMGLFITAGLISLFVNSKQSYRLNENMARLQENARFAVTFIARDVRMTDYRACLTDVPKADALAGVNGGENPDSVSLSWQTNLCGEAGVIRTIAYTIQAGSDGQNALFRSVDGGAAEELVQGIEDMQILYGQDTDNDDTPNFYVDAASITDMAQAMSVKFTLIAGTLETNLTPSGGRITRSFSATVALRNRLP
jgi:type IV pilus assembly protein PilW